MLHQFRVWTVIYHITTKDRSRENRIYVLGIRILVLRIQYEVVPFGPKVDRGFLAKEDECEDIAVLELAVSILRHAYTSCNGLWTRVRPSHLCLALGEELQRVNAIRDGAANDRQPVEHQWRLMRVLKAYLAKQIPKDGDGNERRPRPHKLHSEIRKPSHRGSWTGGRDVVKACSVR